MEGKNVVITSLDTDDATKRFNGKPTVIAPYVTDESLVDTYHVGGKDLSTAAKVKVGAAVRGIANESTGTAI